MNLDVRKVDTIIQKINYLFKTIKKNKDKTLPAEQMLLKKYSTDLLDAMLEAEIRFEGLDPDLLKPPTLSNEINDTGLIAVQNLKQSKETELPELKIVSFDNKTVAENPFAEYKEEQPFAEQTVEKIPLAEGDADSDGIQFLPTEQPQVISEERTLMDELMKDRLTTPTAEDMNVRTEVLGSLGSNLNVEQKGDTKMELNDLLAKDKNEEPNIADKFRHNLAADSFDISESQRFSFVSELFKGDVTAYEKTLRELNKKATVIDAFSYINLNVKVKYGWEDDNPTTRAFQEVIKNRYFRK